jgi:hypothetical protein
MGLSMTHKSPPEFESIAAERGTPLRSTRVIWECAAVFDNSLATRPNQLRALAAKRVTFEHFSRSRLFREMLSGEPALFSNFPISLRGPSAGSRSDSILEEIRVGFPRAVRARYRVDGSVGHLSVPDVVDRWQLGRSTFGVTDLHYIGTRFDRRLNTLALNAFNLLPRGTDGFQSQDSLVISTTGAVTDSHSDDHSGSNHCFTGAKIWLMWDTLEGLEFGLEDVERCDVSSRASFDAKTFLSLRSSRWLIIGPGQTIFVPGHLTHKVITLKAYLGLGSFYVALPNFVDSLIRWSELPPLWNDEDRSKESCRLAFLVRRAIRKVRLLENAPSGERQRWGVPYLKARLRQRDSATKAAAISVAQSNDPNLSSFLRAAQRL